MTWRTGNSVEGDDEVGLVWFGGISQAGCTSDAGVAVHPII